MPSSAIIFFREVFEIVLILGIVLAATRGLPGRRKWIALGFAGGLLGSTLVAAFTDSISMLAEGMGQEIFNAAVLAVAALFIGWTVLWMKRHAREMKAQFTRLGQAVASGDMPFYSLSLVIALAILREGSEMVLFSYGMIASGQSAASIAAGAAIGLLGGSVLGVLIYKGLITISPRYFLQITGWLLVLLVAGMMSQATEQLIAAGYFEKFSGTVWNTAWLIRDDSMVGETLGILLGYTSEPSKAQIFAYALTLLLLAGLIKLTESKSAKHTITQANPA